MLISVSCIALQSGRKPPLAPCLYDLTCAFSLKRHAPFLFCQFASSKAYVQHSSISLFLAVSYKTTHHTDNAS
jgi:hypothetical protein